MVARLGGGAYLAVHAAASLPGTVAVPFIEGMSVWLGSVGWL
jgi:hypothetical protein